MERRKLTDRFIAGLRPLPIDDGGRERARYEIADTEVRQLTIRISASGAKTFYLQARFPSNEARHPVRRAVGASDIGIDEARKVARAWLNTVADGGDPADEQHRRREAARRQREEERRAAGNTFAAVVGRFVDKHLKGKRQGARTERRIRRELVPVWGERPIGEITRADVREVVERIAARAAKRGGSGRYAHTVFDDAKAVLKFAVRRLEIIDSSPFDGLQRSDLLEPKRSRSRILSELEIRAYWAACDKLGVFGSLYRLTLLCGLRFRNEITKAQWPEIDDAAAEPLWVVPASRMKGVNGKVQPHTVPLTPDMLAILVTLPRYKGGDFVFSAPYKFGTAPAASFSRAKKRLVAAMVKELRRFRGDEAAELTDAELLPKFEMQDVRRTVRSGLAMLRVDRDVAEAVVAHVRPGVEGVYDRYDRFKEKKDALERWNAYLKDVVEGPADKVVPLRKVRR